MGGPGTGGKTNRPGRNVKIRRLKKRRIGFADGGFDIVRMRRKSGDDIQFFPCRRQQFETFLPQIRADVFEKIVDGNVHQLSGIP